jgi:hypothetical protein
MFKTVQGTALDFIFWGRNLQGQLAKIKRAFSLPCRTERGLCIGP